MNLSYLIIGAGATGGCIGGFLSACGKDVTFIARGRQLDAMKTKGLTISRPEKEPLYLPSPRVMAQEQWPREKTADVVFVCVKGYSLEGILPLLRRCCHKSTLVIPILNLYGTGEKLAALLPGVNVLDGCIYIASEIAGPGRLLMKGEIFRVVFGPRDGHIQTPLLQKIRSDLAESGITPVLSSQIKKDTYRKFSYVSAQNAVGLYYHANAGEIIRTPEYTRSFLNCVEELRRLGLAFGVRLEDDIAQINLSILSGLEPSMTTSMQKDLAQGGPSEIDGLIYEVVRLGKAQNLSLPLYETIGKALKERYKA